MRFDAETAKAAASGSRVRPSSLFVSALVVGDPYRRGLKESVPSRWRQAQALDAG